MHYLSDSTWLLFTILSITTFFPEVLSDFVHFQRKIQILLPFAFIKSPDAVLYWQWFTHIQENLFYRYFLQSLTVYILKNVWNCTGPASGQTQTVFQTKNAFVHLGINSILHLMTLVPFDHLQNSYIKILTISLFRLTYIWLAIPPQVSHLSQTHPPGLIGIIAKIVNSQLGCLAASWKTQTK